MSYMEKSSPKDWSCLVKQKKYKRMQNDVNSNLQYAWDAGSSSDVQMPHLALLTFSTVRYFIRSKYVIDRHTKLVNLWPWLPWAPWGSEWVRLGSSLPWLPSSQGQTSTLFHLRSWRSHDDFWSGLQWGFSTMHIHRAPGHTNRYTHTFQSPTLPYFPVM